MWTVPNGQNLHDFLVSFSSSSVSIFYPVYLGVLLCILKNLYLTKNKEKKASEADHLTLSNGFYQCDVEFIWEAHNCPNRDKLE